MGTGGSSLYKKDKMPEPLLVAIVEPSPEMHLAIASVLGGTADLRIVEHVRSLPELWSAKPDAIDVVVADLRACVAQPLALAQLRGQYPGLRLVVTTANHGTEYEDAVERLAADGWVEKTELADMLVTTLQRLPH
jgi:DNA-binding NarL/FixJ family response regulator